MTFVGDGSWVLNQAGYCITVGWVGWWDGAGLMTFLGDGTWVLHYSRLGGVVDGAGLMTFLGDGTRVLSQT